LNLRKRLQRIFLLAIGGIAAIAVLAYALDSTIFRLRVAMNWMAYGSVTVTHYTAVLQKNGKTQFTFDPPAPWTCVYALFPHAGLLPCWYLQRHPEQRTDI
jgi:hypothetical protein